MRKVSILILMLVVFSGCATAQIKQQVKDGMNHEQVLAVWGSPDEVLNARNSCCKEGSEEAWHYYGESFRDFDKSVIFEEGEVQYVYVKRGF